MIYYDITSKNHNHLMVHFFDSLNIGGKCKRKSSRQVQPQLPRETWQRVSVVEEASGRNASSMCKDLEPILALPNERVRKTVGENGTEQIQCEHCI